MHLVASYVPTSLLEREEELAELAEFCTSPATAGAYRWWRADAWSGKTALMSWFVLHPPPSVTIVSFFITARKASQNDQTAFLENVLEQLAALLDQDLPSLLTPSTREGHLHGMLGDAAKMCRDRGEKFVLLVDGLDEDRGFTISPSAHSIAALLPEHPPAGMRVIVAGRPNPPIPVDVPDDHPLRDPAIVRPLSLSPHATARRDVMVRELNSLLDGSDTERDLLGLVTAAGGGLSARDLAELTRSWTLEIDRHLRTVTGRTFARQDSHYRPDEAPETYVLGHEELHVTAQQVLGPGRLAEYRSRLHAWAASYRDRRWPNDTPEYLLRGYFNMLAAIRDLPRMVECATDLNRQNRMLDYSGGDTAALNEITTAQDLCLAPPNLVAMARLAVHRDYLMERNSNIPDHLPQVWATLGQTDRAENLAQSLTDREDRGLALLTVADLLIARGDTHRAIALAEAAERIARTRLTSRYQQANVLTRVATVLAKAGDIDRAEAAASSISGTEERCEALSEVAFVLADLGDTIRPASLVERAEVTMRVLRSAETRSDVSAKLARIMTRLGDSARATELVEQARSAADAIADPNEKSHQYAYLVGVVGSFADPMLVHALIDQAETVAESGADPVGRGRALAQLATVLADQGEVNRAVELADHAESVAQAADDVYRRDQVLATVATALATAGLVERAWDLAEHIADLETRSIGGYQVAPAFARSGDVDRALRAADALAFGYRRVTALTEIVKVLLDTGDLHRAVEIARATEEPNARSTLLAAAVTYAVDRILDGGAPAGYDLTQIETLARSIADPEDKSEALARVAWAAASVGDTGWAAELAESAETVARSVIDVAAYSRHFTLVAKAVADADRARELLDRAETIIKSGNDPTETTRGLTGVVTAAAAGGDLDRANRLADEAERAAWSITDTADRCNALIPLVTAMARTDGLGDMRRLAERITAISHDIPDRQAQSRVDANLFAALASGGHTDHASEYLEHALSRASASGSQYLTGEILVSVARRVLDAGHIDRALEIAHSITDFEARSEAYAAVANAAVESGVTDVAAALAEQLVCMSEDTTDVQQRDELLAAAATAVACTGDYLRAKTLTKSITDPYDEGDALISVSNALVHAGDLIQAEDVARGIADSNQRDEALRALVESAARSGDDGRAELLAQDITSLQEQGHALVAIVSSSANDPHRAVAFLARALRQSDWDDCLDALASIAPEAVLAIAHELEAIQEALFN